MDIQPQPPNFSDFIASMQYIVRQLERLDTRTQNLVTRTDLESLRKELVARDSLEPQLTALKSQIQRVDDDRVAGREEWTRRLDKIETDLLTRQDRLWIRIGQAIGVFGFLLALFEFLTHFKFL